MQLNKVEQTPSVYLADKARNIESSGKKVIKFQTGDPFFSTPVAIIEAVNKSMLKGETHYSFAQGSVLLREKISEELNSEIGSGLDYQNILITHGAAQAIFCIFNSLLEFGDEVIVLEPNWPTVNSAIIINGGIPKTVSFLNGDFLIEELNRVFSHKTKAIVFNSPNNPTGIVFSESLIQTILKWASTKGIYIIADEVYRFIQFSDKKSTSLSFIMNYEKYIFVDSFSKKYAMTGFRIGYIASSKPIINLLLKSSQINITHVAPFVQAAAIEALTNNDVKIECIKMVEVYRNQRDYVKDILERNNQKYLNPDGCFYFFLKVPDFFNNDFEFTEQLLHDKNVCVVPGSAYGKTGNGYYRLSYSIDFEELKTGIERIVEFSK